MESLENLTPDAAPKPRVPYTNTVWMQNAKNGATQETFASNISETGIFVQTVDPPRIGSQIRLKFRLEDKTEIEAVAEVKWSKPFEPVNVDGLLPGVGAQFMKIDEESTLAIRNFVNKHLMSTHRPEEWPTTTREVAPDNSGQKTETAKDSYAFEQTMALHLKGETHAIVGYSKSVSKNILRFATDYIPKQLTGKLLRRPSFKGSLSIPVSIEKVKPTETGAGAKRELQLDMKLRCLDLREDLIQLAANVSREIATTLPEDQPDTPEKNDLQRQMRKTYIGFIFAGAILFAFGLLLGIFL